MFYLQKARKLKHAAKFYNRLDKFDMMNIDNLIRVDKVMEQFLELQKHRYLD